MVAVLVETSPSLVSTEGQQAILLRVMPALFDGLDTACNSERVGIVVFRQARVALPKKSACPVFARMLGMPHSLEIQQTLRLGPICARIPVVSVFIFSFMNTVSPIGTSFIFIGVLRKDELQ